MFEGEALAKQVSVIICAYTEDRWHELVAAAESVQRQTLSPQEIIVVIDHNPVLFRRAQASFARVVVLENAGRKGLSGARNTGWTAAQGEIIAFLDDDAVAAPDWLENLAACYTDQDVVGCGGKIVPLWETYQPLWFPAEFHWVVGCTYRGMPAQNAPIRNPIGANMSVRRKALAEVGGFCESFGWERDTHASHAKLKWLNPPIGDEETELSIRVSRHRPRAIWLFVPGAIVRHRVPAQRTRLAYFFWRCYGEGFGKARLVRQHNASAGLSSERTYTFKILPRGVGRGLADTILHFKLAGMLRAGAIITGLMATTFGYLLGKLTASHTVPNHSGALSRSSH